MASSLRRARSAQAERAAKRAEAGDHSTSKVAEDIIGSLAVAGGRRFERKNAWPAKDRWHALGAKLYPSDQALFEGDLRELIQEQVAHGWAPEEPFLETTDSVFALGSCFARELLRYLTRAGVASKRLWIPSGLNNTFAILDFFSWCATGEETGKGFRYDRLESGEIREWKPETERQGYAAAFAEAGAFVFTFGLAEVWEDRETGGVFWRGVPEEVFDSGRHVFRLSTVEENAANIRRIVELVRQLNKRAPIVLTLSPVPLMATFRDVSCMTADCVSKSVLRVALDQVMAESRPEVYYWPSFEVVRWAGGHLPWPAYGLHNRKPRDVSQRLVGEIIAAFIEAFYTPAAVAELRARTGRMAGGRPRLGRVQPLVRPARRLLQAVALRPSGRRPS